MQRITADFTELFRQAPMTTSGYMDKAIQTIDEAFGEGYAKNNPQLVGDFIKACSIDFGSASISVALQGIADRLNNKYE